MTEQPLYRCWCKATDREDTAPRYSPNWVNSRRAWFCVYDDRISCGDWTIAKTEIEQAILYRTRQYLLPVKILQIITSQRSYQFGFNPWAGPQRHLGVAFKEQQLRLKYSLFSITMRAMLVAYLAYCVYVRLRK